MQLQICKLILYENVPQRVLVPFFVHVRRFTELSRGWGIGEETFEFWSWVARQYRVFGELLEIAQQHGFIIPPLPLPTYAPPTSPLPGAGPSEMESPNSSANPLHVLQPPAFYFYTAATCSIERKARYDAAVNATSSALTASPGFASEKTVDHTALIIELLSKANTLLKDSEEKGLSQYIAWRTATTYAAAGQHERAMELIEGLSDLSAGGPMISAELRQLEYECARAAGSVDAAAKLLVEMLPESSDNVAQLVTLLQTTKATSEGPVEVDGAVFDARVAFRSDEAPTGASVAFQIAISSKVDLAGLDFAQLRVTFSDARPDIVIANGSSSRSVNVGTVPSQGENVEAQALLSFNNEALLVTGAVESDLSCQVAISGLVVSLKQDSWVFDLNVVPGRLSVWTPTNGTPYIPVKGLHTSLVFVPRPHDIELEIDHLPSAYVGESVPVTVQITSKDDRELDLRLSALLQPGADADGATIAIDDVSSDSLLKDVDLGKLSPGTSVSKIIHLQAPTGTRVLDLALVSSAGGDEHEILRSTEITFVPPFAPVGTAHVSATRGGPALVSVVLAVAGSRPITVKDIKLIPDDSLQLLASSISSSTSFPQTWTSDSSYAISARFAGQRQVGDVPCASLNISWHAADSDANSSNTTVVNLPPLVSPPPEAFVTASLSTPALVRAHKQFTLSLTLNNAHPTEAAYVSVQGDTADGFVWSGPRGAQIGPVSPASSSVVDFTAIAVGAPGYLVLPHISVWLGHGQDRREVRVQMPSDRPHGNVLVQP